jgi:hypothetical protein
MSLIWQSGYELDGQKVCSWCLLGPVVCSDCNGCAECCTCDLDADVAALLREARFGARQVA